MFSRYCNAKDEDGNYLEDVDIDGHMAFLLFAAFDTTTSAYGDSGKGRKVPEFSRGGGAAIRGMGFKGVF